MREPVFGYNAKAFFIQLGIVLACFLVAKFWLYEPLYTFLRSLLDGI